MSHSTKISNFRIHVLLFLLEINTDIKSCRLQNVNLEILLIIYLIYNGIKYKHQFLDGNDNVPNHLWIPRYVKFNNLFALIQGI
jgi:hypothetical protein